MNNETRYFNRQSIKIGFYMFPAVLIAVGIVISTDINISTIIFYVISIAFLGWSALDAYKNAGVWENDEGIRTKFMWFWNSCKWEDIKEFTWKKKRVYAVLKNGARIPMVAVIQNKPVTWNGGETYDIVGLLNKKLEEHSVQ